jgi:nucleotide-binding universal stress UspA family protein
MLAVDGSNTSDLAVHEAIKLTKVLNAKLRIIYIVDETIFSYIDEYVDFDTLWNGYKKVGDDILNKISKKMKHAQITYETNLIELKPGEGRLAEKIVAEAENWPADMLIIGSHGRRGFSHLILGSVAEHVLRISKIPVLLVRGQ